MSRAFAIGICAVLLASCGGGGSASGTLPKTGGASPAKAKIVQIKLRIKVPSPSTASSRRVARILSLASNTQGIQVAIYAGGSPDTTPIAPTTTGNIGTGAGSSCTTAGTGRTCTISVSAPTGTDDFVIKTYDQLPVGGTFPPTANQLGWAKDPNVTITSGGTNTITGTLSSVLANVSLAFSPNTVRALGPSTIAVSVYATDADDDLIISNQWTDANGNAVSFTPSSPQASSGVNANFSTPPPFSGPPSTPLTITYNGLNCCGASSGGTIAFTEQSNDSSLGDQLAASGSINLIYPAFTSIPDPALSVTGSIFFGGAYFDPSGSVFYYTTQTGNATNPNGSIDSVAEGSSSSSVLFAPAPTGVSILGGLALSGTSLDVSTTTGLSSVTFPAGAQSAIACTPACPAASGSTIAVNPTSGTAFYISGPNVEVLTSGGALTTVPLGNYPLAGMTVDPTNGTLWIANSVTNGGLFELPNGAATATRISLAGSNSDVEPTDILFANGSLWVTDRYNNTVIQLSESGSVENTYGMPCCGFVPWRLAIDPNQADVLYFDSLDFGAIAIGRIDTSTSPSNLSTGAVVDPSSPSAGSQYPGAMAVAPDGTIYMVLEGSGNVISVTP